MTQPTRDPREAMATWLRAGVLLGPLACALAAGCHDPLGPRVIVSNESAGSISVIDVARHDVVATIAVGNRPRGIRVTKDGRTAYVAVAGSPGGIAVVDLARGKLLRTVPAGRDPETFDVVDNRLLVVASTETSELSVVDIDKATIRLRLPAGAEPEGVTVAPDGLVWVTSEAEGRVTAFDVDRAQITGAVRTGPRPRSIAFTSDGKLAVVASELDGVTLIDPVRQAVIARISIPGAGDRAASPTGVVIDREDRRAFVTTGRGGGVAVIDLAACRVERVIAGVGARPWGIAIGTDGLLYTANGSSNDVAVIDPIAGTVLHRIIVGGSPWGVVTTSP